MVWFKVDDGFWGHPKQTGLPAAPIALWVRAGSWSSNQLTDGFVPAHMVAMLGGRKRDAEALVAADLWEHRDDGYQFHDWGEFQPTREHVLREREGAKQRMNRSRKAKRSGSGSADVRANTGRTSGEVRLPRPDPTRPDLSEASVERGSHLSSGPDEPPLYPDRCKRHGNTYEPGNCGGCADARKRNLACASIGPHNPATKPHCGECDETRMLRTRFGAIPCPNCNPAAEEASA